MLTDFRKGYATALVHLKTKGEDVPNWSPNMSDFLDDLFQPSTVVENAQEKRSVAFLYANASLMLEGLIADKSQLARQEKIIQGTITPGQAIAQYLAEHKESE